jgi:hypothetical protein
MKLTVAVAVVGVGLIFASSGACSPPAQKAAASHPRITRTPTALDRALKGLNRDGTWSAATALAVFAATFGPLPGVATPEGRRQEEAGSLAVRMVQARWKELTPAQQQAILPFTASGAGGPSSKSDTDVGSEWSLVGSVTKEVASAGDAAYFQKLINDAVAGIAPHVGRSPGVPIIVVLHDQSLAAEWPWAVGAGGAKTNDCTLHVPWKSQQADHLSYMRYVIHHEVWHCFEYTLLGIDGANQRAPWLMEGQADWVAEAITKGAGQPPYMGDHWAHYLEEPGTRLLTRSYDALGFYAQMYHAGIDPWKKLDPMLLAGSSQAAFQASGATASTFPEGWGSSWLREPNPNALWRMTDTFGIPGPAFRAARTQIELADDDQAAVSGPSYAAGIAELHSTAFVTHFEVTGVGRVGDPAGSLDRVLRAGDSWDICTSPSGNCTCPPDSPNNPPRPPTAPARLNLAATGEPSSDSTLGVQGISKDTWCGRKKPSPSPSASGVGTSCATLLPAGDVQRAVGVSIGSPTDNPYSAFTVTCAWLSVYWSLQAQRKSSPGPVNPNAYGVGCQIAAGNTTVAYCVNADQSGVGGIVMTRSWSLAVVTVGISTDQFINGIIPILARTGA